MNEYIPSPEFSNLMQAAAAAPSAPEAFVHALRARLMDPSAAVRPRNHLRRRVVWALVLGAVLMAACVVIVGPQKVVSTVQKIFGYVPGIGFVDSGSIRVLAEPVTITRNEITITLSEVVADSVRTILILEVEGLGPLPAEPNKEGRPACYQNEILRLPSGTEIWMTGGDHNPWGSGYQSRLIFEDMPPDVNEAELIVPCIGGLLSGKAPETWRIPFRLKPAPPDLTVLPVMEVKTPSVEISPMETPSADADDKYGITLVLEKTVALEDGYLLLGSLHWTSSYFDFGGPVNLSVTDADGKELAAEMDFSYSFSDLDRTEKYNTIPWAIRIQGKDLLAPIRLTAASVGLTLRKPIKFSFDTGPDPVVGQSWPIGQEFNVAGLPVRVLSAKLITLKGRNGFEFAVQAPLEFRFLYFMFESSSGMRTLESLPLAYRNAWLEGTMNETGEFVSSVQTEAEIIGGTIDLSIMSVEVAGPWSVEWNPPAAMGE
ncbi:MAG: DUF4179 domain-containing protein [Anaerolineales bacterium]